jgi:hypothetical protein
LKEGVSELNEFVVKLDFFTKFTCHKLDEHFPLESRMPCLLHIFHPLFVDASGFKKLNCRQVRKYSMYVKVSGDVFKNRGTIKGKLILIFDCHDVTFAHFELDVPFGSTVFETVAQGQ